MPRAVFECVQGWDEDFFFYEEDTDLSVRVREAGHDVWYLSDLEIVHGRGLATRGVRLPAQLEAVRSRFTYICKHFPPFLALLLCCARVLSIFFAATGALAAVLATLGLVQGLRARASRSLVTLLWVTLLMRPRWSLSGRA
jgi:GT2 family glycosyltransferase